MTYFVYWEGPVKECIDVSDDDDDVNTRRNAFRESITLKPDDVQVVPHERFKRALAKALEVDADIMAELAGHLKGR